MYTRRARKRAARPPPMAAPRLIGDATGIKGKDVALMGMDAGSMDAETLGEAVADEIAAGVAVTVTLGVVCATLAELLCDTEGEADADAEAEVLDKGELLAAAVTETLDEVLPLLESNEDVDCELEGECDGCTEEEGDTIAVEGRGV